MNWTRVREVRKLRRTLDGRTAAGKLQAWWREENQRLFDDGPGLWQPISWVGGVTVGGCQKRGRALLATEESCYVCTTARGRQTVDRW